MEEQINLILRELVKQGQELVKQGQRMTRLEQAIKKGFRKNYQDHELIIKVMNETDLDLKRE